MNSPKIVSFLVFVLAFAKAETSHSQTDLGDVLTDLLTISSRYVQPAAQASVYQSSAAWFTSAHSLDLFEVDIAIHANALYIPKDKQTFTVSNDEFRNVTIRGSQSASFPTALGGDTEQFFDFTIFGDSYEFQAFEGVKLDVLPHPYIQATLGLWYDTELIVRFSPNIQIDVSDYGIFGVGLKHNFTQYWDPEKNDAFQVSGLVSYSKFDLNLFFDPFAFRSTGNNFPLAVIDGTIVEAESWLYQLIFSNRWNRIEVFASMGYTTSSVKYRLSGTDNLFVDLLNRVLVILDEGQSAVQIDTGVNYYFDHWYLSSNLSTGEFVNFNLGAHYRF